MIIILTVAVNIAIQILSGNEILRRGAILALITEEAIRNHPYIDSLTDGMLYYDRKLH